MRKLASLSGKVKKNPSSQADSNRYEFLDLQNAEPDFGVPTSNSAVLSSEIDGTRKFLYLDASTFSISNNIITATAAAGDADFLDGQDGAYYLDFTNFTNVPDPVITLSGDATGSTTLTNLANGTITVTVTDNSHNHTVSNISDFTAGANTAIDNRVTKSFVDALNVDADTLDGANGSFYLDYNNFVNTPSIPVSGVDFDPVGTDNSTDVTLAGSYDYLTITDQQITLNQIDYTTDISNTPTIGDGSITFSGDSIIGVSGSFSLNDTANSQITLSVNASAISITESQISDFDTYLPTADFTATANTWLATRSTSNLSEGTNLYYTTARANTDIDARVTKSFVDALNVDADTLDGANGSFYLDYNNFTNTPSIPTSGVDFDPVGTDNSTDVTLAGSYDYLTIAGQQITLGQIDYSTDISNLPTLYTTADANTDIDARVTQAFVNALNVDADTLDGINSTSFLRSDANTSMSTGYLTLANDPTTSLHAATKQYVDTIAAAGIHYHSPVRAEVIGNMTATYNNGTSGVGATLTNAGTQTAFVADGVSLDVGDRVLVYEQTDATQNGVYVVTTVGDGSTNWVLTRADDADSYAPSDPDALGEGDAFFVKEGDTAAGELYVCNTTGTITFGTTNITFIQIAATAVFTAGSGIDLSGTTFSVAAGSGLTQDASGLSHADTSTQASLTALTGANVVSDIDLDGFGHVTSLATRAMTLADLGYTGATDADNYGNWGLYTDNTFRNNITSGENVNFLGGNSITVSYSATNNITINHADTSTQASLTALTGANVVSDIDLDGFGHVTALSTREMTLADFDANLSSFVSTFTLPTVDGSNGQVLTTNGSGTLSFTDAAGGGSYSNSDVDAHLNTSTAANNQVLSWTGSDYDWIDQSAGGAGLTQEQLDTLEILQDDSAYFYTSIGDLYDLSSPKGPTSSIQINNDGIFGGYSSLTYDTTSETLSTNNISLLGDLTVSNNISAANNISVLSLDASGDITVAGDINVGTINTYSIDEIHDRGQLNSSDSAYFYTKLEEIEEKTSGLELLSVETVTTSVSAVDIDLPAGYSRFRLIVQDLTYASTGSYLFGTVSLDGGSTFENTNYAYRVDKWFSSTGTSGVNGYPSNGIVICGNELDTNPTHSIMDIVNTADQFALNANSMMIKPTATAYAFRQKAMGWRQNSSKADVLRLKDFSNNMTGGTFSLYGYKEAL